MEKTNLPFSLVFFIDSQISKECLSDIPSKDLIDLYRKEENGDVRQAMAAELAKRLSDIPSKDLIDLYRKEEDGDVRQAMAAELAKRSDILRIIKKKEFNII